MDVYFSVGEVSKATKIPISTLRYYDKEGVLSPTSKNEKTKYRYYSGIQIPILKAISHMRRLGFSIKYIKSHLEEKDYNHTLELFENTILETRLEIERLKKIEEELSENLKDFQILKEMNQKINKPFFEEISAIEGIRFQGPFKTKKEMGNIMKAMDVFEFLNNAHLKARGFKISEKYWNKNRDVKDEMFAVLEEKEYNDFTILESGICACIYGRGVLENQENISELLEWIDVNGYEASEDIYIFFEERFIFFISKNEFIYSVKIPIRKKK
ncbi:MAG: MerR family transcriptional regulator [Bacilli bacterium]|uniref:MerR family transcriptional regulator n=1 Tax=Cetobacterium sp. TaxID=2071632 RepID=UPI002FC5A2B9